MYVRRLWPGRAVSCAMCVRGGARVALLRPQRCQRPLQPAQLSWGKALPGWLISPQARYLTFSIHTQSRRSRAPECIGLAHAQQPCVPEAAEQARHADAGAAGKRVAHCVRVPLWTVTLGVKEAHIGHASSLALSLWTEVRGVSTPQGDLVVGRGGVRRAAGTTHWQCCCKDGVEWSNQVWAAPRGAAVECRVPGPGVVVSELNRRHCEIIHQMYVCAGDPWLHTRVAGYLTFLTPGACHPLPHPTYPTHKDWLVWRPTPRSIWQLTPCI